MLFDQSFLLICLILFYIFHLSIGSGWNYGEDGPDVWKIHYPQCGKSSQSPINIKTPCTVYRSYASFNFSPAYYLTQTFNILNNGHTIVATLANDPSPSLTVSGGGLDGIFSFVNFHLHWGENYRSGSEHRVNGEKFSGELHLVHSNPTTNQTTVLAFLMRTDQEENIVKTNSFRKRNRKRAESESSTSATTADEWITYLKTAATLTKETNTTPIYVNLGRLVGDYVGTFWRYNGSLTTPPCTEGVIWTVFTSTIYLNDSLLATLRENVYPSIFRDPQALNERIVYRNFLNDTPSAVIDYNLCFKSSENVTNSSNHGTHCTSVIVSGQIFLLLLIFLYRSSIFTV